MNGWQRLWVVASVVALGGCSIQSTDGTYKLYRSSIVSNDAYHIATFDADENEYYNRENCDIARGLFQDQPGVKVRYWCTQLEGKSRYVLSL